MDFLKKYWVIILLVVVAIIIYFMYMKKQQTPPIKTDLPKKDCTKNPSLDTYNGLIANAITAIENDPDWLDYVTSTMANGESLADAKRRHAIYQIEVVEKNCRPASAAA